MAWDLTAGGAVEVLTSTGSHLAWVAGTSTCTVNLYESNPANGDLLYLFGLSGDRLSTYSGAVSGAGMSFDGDHYSTTNLEGDDPVVNTDLSRNRLLFVMGLDGDLVVQETDSSNQADATVFMTIIPSVKKAQNWYYTEVCYGDDCAARYSADWANSTAYTVVNNAQQYHYYDVANQQASLEVRYGGPSIVHLPLDADGNGQGWLMLLSRTRYRSDGAPSGSPLSSNSMSDIVAYWADEGCPEFNVADDPASGAVGVVGPIRIASDIGTLGLLGSKGDGGAASASPGVRFWLSVPTGAMIAPETLAVYFVVNVSTYHLTGTTATDTWQGVMRNLSSFDRTVVDPAATPTFETCIGVHLIALTAIQAQVQYLRDHGRTVELPDGSTVVAEALWDHTDYAATYDLPARKKVLYTWISDDEELVSNAEISLADPQCARCSLDAEDIGTRSSVRLFHSVIGHQRSSSWFDSASVGLWVAQPSSDRKVLRRDGKTLEDTIPGVDFDYVKIEGVVAPFQERTGSAESTIIPIDLDPVLFSDGSWRVAFGQADIAINVTSDGLQEVRGDETSSAEVCSGESSASSSSSALTGTIWRATQAARERFLQGWKLGDERGSAGSSALRDFNPRGHGKPDPDSRNDGPDKVSVGAPARSSPISGWSTLTLGRLDDER